MNGASAGLSWRSPVVLAGLVALAAIAILHQTFGSMLSIWLRSDTFAHGLLIFPVTLWLLWRQREVLRGIPVSVSPLALVAVLLVGLAWVVGRLTDTLVVEQLALVAVLPTLVWLLLGWRWLRAGAFPLAFLVFAVPFGEALIPPLMDFTAVFTVRALELTGIPVYRDGLYFSIPSGDFEVAKACSGIRYLIASVALGSLYAYVTYKALWRRLLFIALSLVVPVLANGLRAYGIVMLAHLSEMRLAVGVDHLVYGWLFFGIVIFLLFWAGGFFREDEEEVPPGAGVTSASGSLAATVNPGMQMMLGALALAVLVAAVVAGNREYAGPGTQWRSPAFAVAGEGWIGPAARGEGWVPGYDGADALLQGRYSHQDTQVDVVMAVYGPRPAAELINSQNRMFDDSIWRRVEQRPVSLQIEGQKHRFTMLRLHAYDEQLLIWYWFTVGGASTNNPFAVKTRQVLNLATGQPQAASMTAVLTDGTRLDANADLQRFVKTHFAALIRCATALDAHGCEQAP